MNIVILEDQAEKAEEELFNDISVRVQSSMQKFCQWRLTMDVFKAIAEEEQERLMAYEEELREKVKEIAPLHSINMKANPLVTAYNDYRWVNDQCCREKYGDKGNTYGTSFWAPIAYEEFEKKGHSESCVKSSIEKLICQDEIIRKRTLEKGYLWMIKDPYQLCQNIGYSDKAYKRSGWMLERDKDLDWMFHQFEYRDLHEQFEAHLEKICASIKKELA